MPKSFISSSEPAQPAARVESRKVWDRQTHRPTKPARDSEILRYTTRLPTPSTGASSFRSPGVGRATSIASHARSRPLQTEFSLHLAHCQSPACRCVLSIHTGTLEVSNGAQALRRGCSSPGVDSHRPDVLPWCIIWTRHMAQWRWLPCREISYRSNVSGPRSWCRIWSARPLRASVDDRHRDPWKGARGLCAGGLHVLSPATA